MRLIAEVTRYEVKQACLLPNVAIGGHTVALLHARGAEEFTQRGRTLKLVGRIFNQARERDVPGVGNVTTTRHLTSFRAGVKFPRPRIENHYARLAQVSANPGRIHYKFRVRMRREVPGFGFAQVRGHWLAFRAPRRQSA